MKRLKRSLRCALIVACSCAAAFATVAPTAVADNIPRPPGAIDNRGYELVTPADKNAQPIFGPALLTADGNKLLYSLGGPTVDDPSGVYPMLISSRTSAGWTSRNILPPIGQMPDHQYLIGAATPDLDAVAVSSLNGLGSAPASSRVALATLDGSGGQTLLRQFPNSFGTSGIEIVASDDLSHIYATVSPEIDPSLPGAMPGVQNVYDFGGGSPVLVSVMPRTGLAPACGVPRLPSLDLSGFGGTQQTQHWTSTDGARVFFKTAGDVCSDPSHLYVRDVDAGTTTQVSASIVGADPDNGVAELVQAAANGSWVMYTSATSLDVRDDDDLNSSDMDVYRWNAATEENLCLTCGLGTSADVTGTVVASEDGSHVYFSSANRFADAPAAATPSAPNTYVWRLGHSGVRFVATTDGLRPLPQGYVTPNGRVLVFMSAQPGLNLVTSGSNGGHFAWYRYDSVDDSITCLSCPPAGAASTDVAFQLALGAGAILGRARPASDDGSIVFFEAPDKLVPEDVNGRRDLYEWHDGVVKLITNGRTVYPDSRRPPVVVSTTADGRDVFFMDAARLTADAQDDAWKMYNARVDGGFEPPPTPPTPCHGDCRGPASSPPSLADPGSESGSGGNVSPGEPGSVTVAATTAAQRARLAARGRIALSLKVSGPGEVEAFAQAKLGKRIRVVARTTATARAAGSLRLVLRLSKPARARLARTGRLRLVIAVSFADALETQRLVVPLKAPKKGGALGAARRAAVRATADGR